MYSEEDLSWETAEAVASSNDEIVLDTSQILNFHKTDASGKNKKMSEVILKLWKEKSINLSIS